MTDSSLLEPSIALAAYAEPLAANRRVLVFGSALGALSLQLLERGARAVHVCDPDAVRVAEAAARNRSSQITFSALADSDLSVRDGSFELSVIENLGAFDALSILRKAHRALAPRGVAVVACPNPEAAFPLLRASNPSATVLDYYALYDAVAAEFEHVRMLGQTPFVGYAIADFSASGEPEPALDTSFVPGGAEEPDVFIAMAAGHEVRLDEFAVIQLPTRQMLASVERPKKAEKAEASPTAAKDARELARLNHWIGELEARASTADERADNAETELEELRGKLEAEQMALAAERATLAAERATFATERAGFATERTTFATGRTAHDTAKSRHEQELATLRAELTAKKSELSGVGAELAERDRQLAERAAHVDQEAKGDLTELERQLAERGTEVRRLEGDLRTAERTGRELVRELERRRGEQSAQAGAELERALAEREADLQAAAWTIESLSLRLELAGKPGAPPSGEPETPVSDAEAR
jgi:predicted  nucleic acid-binding Zn-ribbon protein/SAM-dependent methyltransferase